jgi:hypothetical protein
MVRKTNKHTKTPRKRKHTQTRKRKHTQTRKRKHTQIPRKRRQTKKIGLLPSVYVSSSRLPTSLSLKPYPKEIEMKKKVVVDLYDIKDINENKEGKLLYVDKYPIKVTHNGDIIAKIEGHDKKIPKVPEDSMETQGWTNKLSEKFLTVDPGTKTAQNLISDQFDLTPEETNQLLAEITKILKENKENPVGFIKNALNKIYEHKGKTILVSLTFAALMTIIFGVPTHIVTGSNILMNYLSTSENSVIVAARTMLSYIASIKKYMPFGSQSSSALVIYQSSSPLVVWQPPRNWGDWTDPRAWYNINKYINIPNLSEYMPDTSKWKDYIPNLSKYIPYKYHTYLASLSWPGIGGKGIIMGKKRFRRNR